MTQTTHTHTPNSFDPPQSSQESLSQLQRRPFPHEVESKNNQTTISSPLDTQTQEKAARAQFNPERISLYPANPVKEEKKENPIQKKIESSASDRNDSHNPIQKKSESLTSEPDHNQDHSLVQKKSESIASDRNQDHFPLQWQSQRVEQQNETHPNKLVQTKLTVGKPGDRYEQEADRVAARVMTMPDPTHNRIQRQSDHSEANLQAKSLATSITPLIQRQTNEEAQAKGTKPSNQVNPEFENRLASSTGGGSPLPGEVRSFMESRFGVNLGHVRVHTDVDATHLNKDMQAQAFTYGNHIFYGAGKSPGKDELTAHELTHVIQQTGAVQPKFIEQSDSEISKVQSTQVQRKHAQCEAERHNAKPISTQVISATSRVKTKPDERMAVFHDENPNKSANLYVRGSNFLTAFTKADLSKVQASKRVLADATDKHPTKHKFNVKDGTLRKKLASKFGKQVKPTVHRLKAHNSTKTTTHKASKDAARKTHNDLATTHAQVKHMGGEPVMFALPQIKQGANAQGRSMSIHKTNPAHAAKQLTHVKKQQEKQRITAGRIATQFLARNAGQLQKVTAVGKTITPRIQNAAATAQATIQATIQKQQGVVIARINQLQAQARSQATAAKAQVIAQHNAAISAIRIGTKTARDQVNQAHQTTLDGLKQREDTQIGKLDQLYADGEKKYRDTGPTVGKEAMTTGQQWHDRYMSQVKGKDDNIWDGPLTDDRLKARADTAIKVAEEYQKQLIAAANQQADKVKDGKPNDQKTIHDSAEQSRKALNDQHKAALDGLDHTEQQAIASADQTRQQFISSIDQRLTATIRSLQQQQATQLQQLRAYGQSQCNAVKQQADQACTSLQASVKQATTKLQGDLNLLRVKAKDTPAPKAKVLQASLGKAQVKINQAVAAVQTKVPAQANTIAQAIVKSSHNSVQTINQIGQGTIQSATSIEQGLTTALAGITKNASTTLNQLQQNHVQTVTTSAKSAVDGFQEVNKNIDKLFETINQSLDKGFGDGAQKLETSLRDSLKSLEGDIQKYGDEAAAKIEPRWKTVLKWALIIVVTLVVAIWLGPLVIGFVGALAGPLLGAIIGGAIVGAISGAVIQMGNNLIDGKFTLSGIMEGVGEAALLGAIGGAIGGVGGLAGQGLGAVAGKGLAMGASKIGAGLLTQAAVKVGIKFGTELAFDIASSVISDLVSAKIEGREVTAKDIWNSAVQGAAFSVGLRGVSAVKPIKGIQERYILAASKKWTFRPAIASAI
jgi:hypothetical protein